MIPETLSTSDDRRLSAPSADVQTHAIIGAAMEVHRLLGPGFVEPVYQHAMARELFLREIPYFREAELPVHYKGRVLPCTFRADFICFDSVIVELKALQNLSGVEESRIVELPQGHPTRTRSAAQLRHPRPPVQAVRLLQLTQSRSANHLLG